MFKKIPGNKNYRINLQKQIVDEYGQLVNFEKIEKRSFTLDIFGVKKKMEVNILSLLAWYEVGYIDDLQKHLDKIKFYPSISTLSVTCSYMMVFTEPLYYKEGFRYIPCYPRYAINIDSEIIDTFTNQLVTSINKTSDGYVCVYLYSPDKNANRNIRIHRLLALAWLPNFDFVNKPIINHIDGKRDNNKLENLEWCNSEHNARHALETGLNSTPIKMKSRDVYTGDVVVYNSAAEMSRVLGMSGVKANFFNITLPGYLHNKRYEIKVLDDNSPWYYEDTDFIPDSESKSIYSIVTLNKKTGETKKFSNVRPFYKAYGLWTKSGRIDEGVSAFKEKYPDFEISYKRNAVSGPYRVFNLENKQVIIVNSILDVAECIDRTRSEIQFDLSRKLKFIYSGKWVIAAGNDKIVLEEYRDKPKPYAEITIVDTKNNSERKAPSIKQAARLLGIDPKTITRHLNTGNLVKGLLFRALE